MKPSFCFLLALSGILSLTSAVKFDLIAVSSDHIAEGTKCLSQYVPKDTLVHTTINIGEGYNQRVQFEIADDSEGRNIYIKKTNVEGELRNAFSTNRDGEILICFANVLNEGFKEAPQYKRAIELQVNIGAEAAGYQNSASTEKLTPLDLELRKLETVVQEIVEEMNYLKRREAKMRDTNGNYTLY
ncbi:emp24/gp25L/p24 family/GOLD-domain-containing protein [Pilobolus umbonatus]|nr:emp24/gp25L/p24 family/GOLD-domain-containing protein [Pilobolus umbonatus]